MDLRLHTEDELKELRCEAVETEDMRLFLKVKDEINRRWKDDD